jgi:molecular chaperone Hsp33
VSDPSSDAPIELAFPDDDLVLPFQAEQADVLGRLVKLGPTVDTILSRHAYPEPVSRLLGEAVALTALLGASLKSDGKLILQTTTDGPVDLLVADYLVPGALRGYARFDAERLAALDTDDDAALLGQGHLAMTIDRGLDTERYQGVVPLDAPLSCRRGRRRRRLDLAGRRAPRAEADPRGRRRDPEGIRGRLVPR